MAVAVTGLVLICAGISAAGARSPSADFPAGLALTSADALRLVPREQVARNLFAPLPSPLPAAPTPTAAPADLRRDVTGIPSRVQEAYRSAADRLSVERPSCGLKWWLIAGIGMVESGHGTVGGAQVDRAGRVTPEILGVRLDGVGPVAQIRDTDRGLLDGDREFDRAIGPMQFLPETWARYGADGDGDGRLDPHDIDDVTLAAGRYLCTTGGALAEPAGLVRAVYSYNQSYDYVRSVLSVAARYAGLTPQALGTGLLPATVDPSPTRAAGSAPTSTSAAVGTKRPAPSSTPVPAT